MRGEILHRLDQDSIGVINKTSSGGSLTAINHYHERKSILVSSYDSDEEIDKIKDNFQQISVRLMFFSRLNVNID